MKNKIKKQIEEIEREIKPVPETDIYDHKRYDHKKLMEVSRLKAQLKGYEQGEKSKEKEIIKKIKEYSGEKEFEDYEGERTEYVKIGFELAKNKILKSIGDGEWKIK